MRSLMYMLLDYPDGKEFTRDEIKVGFSGIKVWVLVVACTCGPWGCCRLAVGQHTCSCGAIVFFKALCSNSLSWLPTHTMPT